MEDEGGRCGDQLDVGLGERKGLNDEPVSDLIV